jgi:hypothetical protein
MTNIFLLESRLYLIAELLLLIKITFNRKGGAYTDRGKRKKIVPVHKHFFFLTITF